VRAYSARLCGKTVLAGVIYHYEYPAHRDFE